MKDEKAILKRLKNGDMMAFDAVYALYSRKLYSFSYSLLKDHYLSEELVQDVFVSLWERRHQVDPELSFENYVFTICFNSIRKSFRKSKLEIKLKDYLQKNSPQTVMETSNTVIYRELIQIVERSVEKMPPRRKAVFKLSREEGKQIKEIADKLNISSRTAESHLNKALKFIRQELEKASLYSLLILCFLI